MFSEVNALGLTVRNTDSEINVRLAIDCSMSVAASTGYLGYVLYNNGAQL